MLFSVSLSFLEFACSGGHLSALRIFLALGLHNPNSLSAAGVNLLHIAAYNGQLAILKELIDVHDGLVNLPGSDGLTCLHIAAIAGNCGLIAYLLEECKCDPLVRSALGLSSLHFAVLNSHESALKLLISHCDEERFDVDDRSFTGLSGLALIHFAAQAGHRGIAEYLVGELNCDLSLLTRDYSLNLIQIAVQHGNADLLDYFLLRLGSSAGSEQILHVSSNGFDALTLACNHKQTRCLSRLLEFIGSALPIRRLSRIEEISIAAGNADALNLIAKFKQIHPEILSKLKSEFESNSAGEQFDRSNSIDAAAISDLQLLNEGDDFKTYSAIYNGTKVIVREFSADSKSFPLAAAISSDSAIPCFSSLLGCFRLSVVREFGQMNLNEFLSFARSRQLAIPLIARFVVYSSICESLQHSHSSIPAIHFPRFHANNLFLNLSTKSLIRGQIPLIERVRLSEVGIQFSSGDFKRFATNSIQNSIRPWNFLAPEIISAFSEEIQREKNSGHQNSIENNSVDDSSASAAVAEKNLTPPAFNSASDLFSFGLIVFHLSTGIPPFQGISSLAEWESLCGANADRPNLLSWPEIGNFNTASEGELNLMRNCLSLQPVARSSVAEILRLLADLEAEERAKLRKIKRGWSILHKLMENSNDGDGCRIM